MIEQLTSHSMKLFGRNKQQQSETDEIAAAEKLSQQNELEKTTNSPLCSVICIITKLKVQKVQSTLLKFLHRLKQFLTYIRYGENYFFPKRRPNNLYSHWHILLG